MVFSLVNKYSDQKTQNLSLYLSEPSIPDLPWRDCTNEWNSETCRNPYETKFDEACKLSTDLYPCADLGKDYRDCKVNPVTGWYGIYLSVSERNNQFIHSSFLWIWKQTWWHSESVCEEYNWPCRRVLGEEGTRANCWGM